MGRTGEMFAWQHYGVKAGCDDRGKGPWKRRSHRSFLACGKAATAMVPGDHGTTYGGNPLVTAAAGAVLDIFEKKQITDHVKEVGAYLYEKLEELTKKYDIICGHRGRGLSPGAGVYRSCRPYCIKSSFRGEAGFDQCRQPYYPVCAAAYYSEVGCG